MREMERSPNGTRLAGKAAIVFGAGTRGDYPGTGAATARLFAAHGARVAVVGLCGASAGRTVELIASDGGQAIALLGDVTDDDACARMIADAAGRLGRLDIVVNNVARYDETTVEAFDEGLWADILRTNLTTPLRTGRHAVPHLRAAGGGAIINIGSVAGRAAHGGIGYGVSKAALEPLTRDMAMQLGPHGIRVNCIVPGHLHTPHVGETLPAEARRRRAAATMLGTEGDGWDVAWAAVFLASDEARLITAQSIVVDGGATAIQGLTQAQRLNRAP